MNKVTKLVVSIGVGILCISFCSVNIQAEEPALPDFVITDTQVSPQTVHVGEQVLVTALLGNVWPLTIGEINIMSVEVGFSINENVTFFGYVQTGCTNNACGDGAPCINVWKCPANPGFHWDIVRCQELQGKIPPCRCVYYIRTFKQFAFEQPGIYRIGFVADPNQLIVEANETNNSQIIEIEVLPIIITK